MLKNLFSLLLIRRADSLHPSAPSRHFWSIVAIFTGLGFYVGVWTVLVADLAVALKLSSVLLGIALSCFSCAGIVLLVFGSTLANRLTRRLILLLGVGGLGLFFLILAFLSQIVVLFVLLVFGGACASCYDLAVNSIGGDYERSYAQKTMTLFHAGFSGGATLGALGSAIALANGIGFRAIYGTTGLLFLLLAGATLFLPLPSTVSRPSARDATVEEHSTSTSSAIVLLVTPLVLFATILVSLSFFTDGALEGYTSVYLRNLLGSGALFGGMGIAAFYLVGMIGRLSSTAALRRYGDRPVITVAGMLSALGMVVTLSTTSAPLAVSGLLLVGLGQSPLVPTAFSLAARIGSHQGARAVAIVTAFGYSIFLISPLLIGFVATLFSLRIALLLTIATSLGVVLIAQRLPLSAHEEEEEERKPT